MATHNSASHDSAAHSPVAHNSTLQDLSHGILEDSTFAAFLLPDGGYSLAFQDISGELKQASCSLQYNDWKTLMNNVVSVDAKNYAPLAVTSWSCEALYDIHLRYQIQFNP